MIDQIRDTLKRQLFDQHGVEVSLVSRVGFEGNSLAESSDAEETTQTIVVKKTDKVIDQTTGSSQEMLLFIAPHDTLISTGSVFKRDGRFYRAETSPKEAYGMVSCYLGAARLVDVAIAAPNHPDLTFLRGQEYVDDYLNPIGWTWSEIGTVEAHVEHVKGQMTYKEGLLLQNTEYVVSISSVLDIHLQDRTVIYGKPFKVDDINLNTPGLQHLQVSSDMR